jgi:hypothetical protein
MGDSDYRDTGEQMSDAALAVGVFVAAAAVLGFAMLYVGMKG